MMHFTSKLVKEYFVKVKIKMKFIFIIVNYLLKLTAHTFSTFLDYCNYFNAMRKMGKLVKGSLIIPTEFPRKRGSSASGAGQPLFLRLF
jgi:hypothetical protein